MKYVIDCSTAFNWVIPEPDSAKAVRLWDDYRNSLVELLAPDLFPTEIGNSLLIAERRGRIAAGDGARLFADVLRALPALHHAIPLLPRAYEIAHTARQTVYDCLYVALAEREQYELVTADTRLINSLHPTFPFVRDLSTFP